MRLPLKTFNIQPPLSGDEWRFNLARQNYGTSFKYDAKPRGDAVLGRELSMVRPNRVSRATIIIRP